ncbi:MAG: PDZ domain-containing protein [Ignavibacteria bacterium]|nr:PDZ domain-containing protein [Ignavibacteria bacterium]
MNRIKIISITALLTLLVASIAYALIFHVPNKSNNNYGTFGGDTSVNAINTQNKKNISDDIASSRQTIITQTVKEVSPAVVGINVTEIRQYRDIWSMDPFFRQFFGDRVYSQPIKSLGSGVIISQDGYVLTNDHVAGNAVEAIVTMTDGTQHEAKIIGSDPVSDICLLKIEGDNLPHVKFGNSDNILIGEWVVALGNPFGLFDINDQPTVTVGVISSKGMNLGAQNNRYYVNMLQTDAAINTGNSGGPLVNAFGELIGLNTLIYTAGSAGNIGVGFAIPINKIIRILDELRENGKVDRDFWTGLSVQTIDQNIAKAYNLQSTRGVIVTQITRNSPAHKSGLEVYDIIIAVNQYKVNNENTLIGILQEFRNGDDLVLQIMRDNKQITKKMKLERRK